MKATRLTNVRLRLILLAASWEIPTLIVAAAARSAGGASWSGALLLGLALGALFAVSAFIAPVLTRLLPLRPGQTGTSLINHLASAMVLAALWTWAARVVAWWLRAPLHGLISRSHSADGLIFLTGLLLYSLMAAGFYVADAVARALEAQNAADRALLLARESELRALRAQIDPHFLFNSLHSISALTSIDAARARQMCIHLAELFRHTLHAGRKETITLAEELEVINSYLAVEQVRFGARLGYRQQVAAGSERNQIPALLLQPLVENAVKHGVASLTGPGRIELDIRQTDGRLLIQLENSFDPEEVAPHRGGVGLVNVRQRLEARYPGAATLDSRIQGDVFSVSLSLPAITAPPPHP